MGERIFDDRILHGLPFTSKEYFITAHESRYSKINFFTYLNAFLRLVLSVFGCLRKLKASSETLIYHGGYKTRKECIYFQDLLGSSDCLTDRCLSVEDRAFKRMSSLVYFISPDFLKILRVIINMKEINASFKFLLVSDLIWNYGYYSYLRVGNLKRVVSFYSTTTSAFILSEFCRNNNLRFIYYAWGSNICIDEFQYGSSDLVFAKNQHDAELFDKKQYGKLVYCGDIAIKKVLKPSYSVPKAPRVLILDTCISSMMSLDRKKNVYDEISSCLSKIEGEFFVRPHPATQNSEIQALLSDANFSYTVVANSDDINKQILSLNIDFVVNINSTLRDVLVCSGIPVVDFYLLLDPFYGGLDPQCFPGLVYVKNDVLHESDVILFSEKVLSFMKVKGLKEIDSSLVLGELYEK